MTKFSKIFLLATIFLKLSADLYATQEIKSEEMESEPVKASFKISTVKINSEVAIPFTEFQKNDHPASAWFKDADDLNPKPKTWLILPWVEGAYSNESLHEMTFINGNVEFIFQGIDPKTNFQWICKKIIRLKEQEEKEHLQKRQWSGYALDITVKDLNENSPFLEKDLFTGGELDEYYRNSKVVNCDVRLRNIPNRKEK